MKGCREKFVCQDVHMSLSGGFASDVMSGSDTCCKERDTTKMADRTTREGRECRFVSIDKERKQNAVNFNRVTPWKIPAACCGGDFEVQGERPGAGAGRRSTRDGWWTCATRKEHSQQQARQEHRHQQARTERSQQRVKERTCSWDKKKRITDRKSRSLVKSWKDAEQEQAASQLETDANLVKKLQYSR